MFYILIIIIINIFCLKYLFLSENLKLNSIPLTSKLLENILYFNI